MTKIDANRNLGWSEWALWQGVGGASVNNSDDLSARQAIAHELGYRHSRLMATSIGEAK
ncbi:MAG: hypothetical protein ACE5HM_05555 [Acidiferrobacterales bacterium]